MKKAAIFLKKNYKKISVFLAWIFLAATKKAALAASSPDSIEIRNPLKWENLEQLTDAIIGFAFKLGIWGATFVIILAAYELLFSEGKPDNLRKAKNMIIWALVGLIVLFLSKAIISLVKEVLGVKQP